MAYRRTHRSQVRRRDIMIGALRTIAKVIQPVSEVVSKAIEPIVETALELPQSLQPTENTFERSTEHLRNHFTPQRYARHETLGGQAAQGLGDVGTVMQHAGSFVPGPYRFGTQILGSTLSAGGHAATAGKKVAEEDAIGAAGELLGAAGSLLSFVPGPVGTAGKVAQVVGGALANHEELEDFAKDLGDNMAEMKAEDWIEPQDGFHL